MTVLSKLRELSLPYNCYEVGHTWDPECCTAALSVGACCLLEGAKLYAPLYLITQLLQRKWSVGAFVNTLQSISTSSCFLGVNGFAFIFIFCLLRKSMGKFYYLHCSYFPAFVASFLAILVERKNRRGPLALYVTNVATETMFRMLAARGIVKPFPNGEIYLFSITMAFLLFIIRSQGFSNDFVSAAFKYVLGREEAASPRRPRPSPKEADPWRHPACPHTDNCLLYSAKGLLRPLLLGYSALSLIRLVSGWSRIVRRPALLPRLLTERKTLSLGLFLGGFGATFRAVNCLLRWVWGRDHPSFALPAAFLGGFFMKFFPSSTLALYFTWKLVEIGYGVGMASGVLPEIRGSMLILYAASTAFLFYAAVLEPHNLKPAYLKFLTRLTHNKIGEINRHVLDIFGTHASRLYSHFWPQLELEHTSRVFQESVLLWLIH